MEKYIGEEVDVTPMKGDSFKEFTGMVTGVRNGFIQVKDQDDNVFEVEEKQVKIN